MFFCSDLHTTSKDVLKTYQTWKVLYAEHQFLTKSRAEPEDYCIVHRGDLSLLNLTSIDYQVLFHQMSIQNAPLNYSIDL